MGWGQLCQIAKCMGIDVYGIDHSPVNIDYAKRCGIKTVDLKEVKNMEFDFINTDQVFEHLTDPLGELRLLEKGLAQNGIIMMHIWARKRVKETTPLLPSEGPTTIPGKRNYYSSPCSFPIRPDLLGPVTLFVTVG